MKARIKISQFTHKFKTLLDNFGWQSFASNIFGCESITNHNIALEFFNNKIWFNQRQNIIQHGTSCLPVINWASKFLFTSPSISRIFRTSKSIFKPYYYSFITTSYLKTTMPLKAISIFALFNMANINATFSINESRKISYFSNCMIGFELYYFTHVYPFINNITVINEEVHAERLSEKTQQWDAIV